MFLAIPCLYRLCYLSGKLVQQSMHVWLIIAGAADFTAGMHDRCMVTSSQVPTNLLEAVLGQTPGKVHTYLPRFRNGLAAPFTLQVS